MSAKAVAVLAAVGLVSGCVTHREVTLPNGKVGLSISCDGTARDWTDCMNYAAETCGGPYTIFTSDGRSFTSSALPNGYGGVFFIQGEKRTMIVQCGQ